MVALVQRVVQQKSNYAVHLHAFLSVSITPHEESIQNQSLKLRPKKALLFRESLTPTRNQG